MSDEDAAAIFAGWLLERMGARGMSQRMLAHRAGVNHATISRLRRGQATPSLVTALRLARVLGMDSLVEAFR